MVIKNAAINYISYLCIKPKVLNNKIYFYCSSPLIRKNGKRNGHKRYICYCCEKSFTSCERMNVSKLWELNTQGKQSNKELSNTFRISESTIKKAYKSGYSISISNQSLWNTPILFGNNALPFRKNIFPFGKKGIAIWENAISIWKLGIAIGE